MPPNADFSSLTSLESYGIETAADVVSAAVLTVPGFGDVLTNRLLSWRATVESQFRFDSSRGVPQADLMRIRNRYLQMSFAYQQQLRQGHAELIKLSMAAKSEVDSVLATLRLNRIELAQAQADFDVTR